MSAELKHIWSRLQTELASAVGESTYRIWLEPLTASALERDRLTIEVPEQSYDWVRERFGRVLQACAASVLSSDVIVELLPSAGAASPAGSGGARRRSASLHAAAEGETGPGCDTSGELRSHGADPDPLIAAAGNPKLTFDQFVIGDCNRLAHAAALTVAEMPAQAYNPLFICGPPGVGKTHLLSSIANLLLTHNPGLAVRSTTGEGFTNEFLHALAGRRTNAFKTRHRRIDVLLVDDVQFLERKTRTEEEFFHTFNALYDAGRQIVLTSDRPPRDLQALEDRLRERFESGLVADIRAPEMATRMTILRKRAQHDRLELADEEPLRLIAERVADNVRAIEGALIRVVAFSSLTGRPLTAELTREVLDGLYPAALSPAPSAAVSVAEIKAAACAHFGLTSEELLSTSRRPHVAWPRQVAMYLARELTGESLPAIGRQFGGRDHTTVLHAHRRTTARIAAEDSAREVVNNLLDSLRTTSGHTSAAKHDRHS